VQRTDSLRNLTAVPRHSRYCRRDESAVHRVLVRLSPICRGEDLRPSLINPAMPSTINQKSCVFSALEAFTVEPLRLVLWPISPDTRRARVTLCDDAMRQVLGERSSLASVPRPDWDTAM
jgi:hypothetical protein